MIKTLSTRSFSAVQVTNRAGKAYNVPDKLIINGEYVNSVSGKTFDNISPSNEQVINQVAAAQKEKEQKEQMMSQKKSKLSAETQKKIEKFAKMLKTLNGYKELLTLVEGQSVMLEEYAREMIYTEELHLGEVDKMLRNPGDVKPFSE